MIIREALNIDLDIDKELVYELKSAQKMMPQIDYINISY